MQVRRGGTGLASAYIASGLVFFPVLWSHGDKWHADGERRKKRVRGEEENDGLHCRRYALKLTCQTLKVCCALTHASLNITPPQCSAADLSLRFKPLCGALLAQEIIRCSISFCVDERRETKKVLRIVLYIFFNRAVFMRQSFIRLKKLSF